MEKKIVLLLMVPFLLFWHWFEPAAKKNQQGLNAYDARKYEQALQNFLSAKGIKPDLPQLKSNTASTLYQLKKYKAALEEFSKIDPERSGISRSDFLYNLGNAFFRLNQFDKALESYKGSLMLNPGDINAKKNYELTQKKLKEQKNRQKKDQDTESDKKSKDQEKEQNRNKKQNQHQNLMQYLNQNEKKQMKKKQRKLTVVKKDKDW
jgi:Ca-activated chloride channel family protein